MLIRCYGARGGIAVSGREYLKYGGDTTCIEIRSEDDKIIIVDAGSGIRRRYSTYVDALDLAFKAQVKRFGLFHHNQERTDADQETIVQRCREIIKDKKNDMECFALTQSTKLKL